MKSATLAKLPSEYTAEHITVTYSSGSVKIAVTIAPIDISDTDTLMAQMSAKKGQMVTAAQTTAKSLPNVENLLESGTTTNDIVTTASEPTKESTTTIAMDSGPTVQASEPDSAEATDHVIPVVIAAVLLSLLGLVASVCYVIRRRRREIER